MTLKEIQVKIASALNADETLRQGGCMAFAEDAMEYSASKKEECPPGHPAVYRNNARLLTGAGFGRHK